MLLLLGEICNLRISDINEQFYVCRILDEVCGISGVPSTSAWQAFPTSVISIIIVHKHKATVMVDSE